MGYESEKREPMRERGEWLPELQCRILRVSYDFNKRRADLFLPVGECTDMTGAIGSVTHIDPDARMIQTWAGDKPDTSYVWSNGVWYAVATHRCDGMAYTRAQCIGGGWHPIDRRSRHQEPN